MKKPIFSLGLLLVLLLQACGDSTSSPTPSRIVINPFSTNMDAIGQTVQYSARLEDQNGKEIPGATFSWSTTNSDVASITSSGLLTGLKAGTTSVRATYEELNGNASLTIDPVPTELQKVSGDGQQGSLRQVLPTQIVVEVQDANGNPVAGKFVTFAVTAGGGTATPWQVQTGVDGRASSVWQLGCSNDNPQTLDAKIGSLTASFSAMVDLGALAICQETVPAGRETQAYSTTIVAAGGDPGTQSWSVVGGALPLGLNLQPDGVLSGTPAQAGSFFFTAKVQDGQGGMATATYDLRICDAPLALAPGESTSLAPSEDDPCGFFLPAGADGDRYRFGVIYTRADEAEADVPTVNVDLFREAGGVPGSASLVSSKVEPVSLPEPRMTAQEATALREALEIKERTRAFHYKVREAEKELLRKLGPNARPLPDTRGPSMVSGPARVAPDKLTFTNSTDLSSCDIEESRRAVKVAENEAMVIYQDSIQRDSDPLPEAHAQAMVSHYASYGKQIIDTYFGGVSDINEDGQIVVFVTPIVEEGTAAYVWSGDFFPKNDQPGWAGCAASNEMEMMRFNLEVIKGISQGNFQAPGTAVHETKHISSLYKGLMRFGKFDPYYQPTWIEEGTAESAEERAARVAWAAEGGPTVGAMAHGSDVNDFTQANYSTITVNAGAKGYLSSQPNSLVVDPVGASQLHTIYGSGWHFHRWLGDVYGNASQALADSTLSRILNDSTTAVGVTGILNVTGAPSWQSLLEDYILAIMLNGTGAPQGAKAFTSYHFPSFHNTFHYVTPGLEPEGDYPWPVNTVGEATTAAFLSASNVGSIGPSGVRIFDLTSNGTGLGVEVEVSTSSGMHPFRIVVVRIQ